MEKVRGDLQNLYQREEPHPIGLPLSAYVDLTKVNNEVPSEEKV